MNSPINRALKRFFQHHDYAVGLVELSEQPDQQGIETLVDLFFDLDVVELSEQPDQQGIETVQFGGYFEGDQMLSEQPDQQGIETN